ncbi:MAG: AbrB/MazE/SpoVT family DNA-binding domain-containing protein [Chloroflexota bacterium]|jgi:AbrB family looped-hinge helix DNA binding protein
MSEQVFHHSRIRSKGQITLPGKIRTLLGVKEGDELVFRIDEGNRISIERAQIIPTDQVWFWSERWQRLEHEAQDDIDAGKQKHFDTTDAALNFLHKAAEDSDAKD